MIDISGWKQSRRTKVTDRVSLLQKTLICWPEGQLGWDTRLGLARATAYPYHHIWLPKAFLPSQKLDPGAGIVILLLLVSQAREHRGHRDNIPEGTAPGSDSALGPTDFLHSASHPCIPSTGWQNPTPHTLSSVKTLWVALTTRLSRSFIVTAGNSRVSLMTSLMVQSVTQGSLEQIQTLETDRNMTFGRVTECL